MIKELEVSINEQSFEISNLGSIIGEIYFKVGTRVFPEPRWSDSVVVLLTSWLNALKGFFQSKGSVTCDLFFMDGPFLARVIKLNDHLVTVQFISRRICNEEKMFSVDCSFIHLIKTLLMSSEKVLKAIVKRNWNIEETNDLLKAVTNLTTQTKECPR